MKNAKLVAAAFLSLCLSHPAHAQPAPEPPELEGPPLLTPAGCRADREFTRAYVASVVGASEAVVRRMLTRYALHPVDVCRLAPEALRNVLDHTRMNKFGYDEPDKAMEYRRLSYLDESGDIKPNGLAEAMAQRLENLNAPKPKVGGITQASWASLGPFNTGGRVRAIAPHPTIPNRILVGSVSGGIFKSVNGGTSWTVVNDNMASVAIACLIHDPNNANIVYACTGEGAFSIDAVRGLGIFKSTDAGDTWTQMTSTNPGTAGSQWYYVNRLAVDPSNSNILLAATGSGLYRSADGGGTWTNVYPSRRVFDVKFNTTAVQGALGSRAVLGEHRHFTGNQADGGATAWSGDHGATWTRVPIAPFPIPGANNYGRVELAYSASTGNWFAQVDYTASAATNSAAGGQLYKSINGGQSWALLGENQVLGGQGWYDNALWVAPNDENRVIIGGGGAGIKMSMNGGLTFASIGQGVHVDHHALVSDPGYATNGIVYNGNDGGVYKLSGVQAVVTPSGTSPAATNLNNGLPITQFYGASGSKLPTTRLIGGTQDNGTWVYNAATTTWTQVAGGDGAESAADPTDSAYLFGSYQYLAVHRNTTGGTTSFSSQSICAGIPDSGCPGFSTPPNTNFISPIALDPSNPNRLYAGSVRLWRTDNAKAATPAGVTWTEVKPTGTAISYIAVAPSNPDIVWVGDNGGAVYRTQNATAVTPTWSSNLSSIANRQVLNILIDPVDPARVIVAYGGYQANNLRLTTNGLDPLPTWTDRSGAGASALPAAPVRTVARHPGSNLWLYAGTEVGVFVSLDGGASWNATNDGPGTVSVEQLFFLDATTLIAATHGRGLFQATVTPPAQSPGVLQLSAANASIAEGATASLTVSRVGGTFGAVSVTVSSAGGTATSGTDFTPLNQVLSWPNGDATNRTVTLTALDDAIVEGTETFTVSLSAPTGGAALGSPSTTTVSIVERDVFPPNCAMPAGWTTPVGANGGWNVDASTALEGSCSLRSGTITDSQRAQVQFTGTTGAGNITFNARVSAEATYDCLRFFLDGAEKTLGTNCTGATPGGVGLSPATATTDTGWQAFSFPVTAGSHTLLFSYEKDSSVSDGADAAWLDNLVLPSAAPTVNLTVTRAGAGSGTVTSSVGGINCGATCSGSVNAGAAVTLTATPLAGSVFTGWTGACSGTGTCNLVPTANVSVTATFSLALGSPSLVVNNAAALAFGGQSVKTTSPVVVVDLVNAGTGTLTLTSVVAAGANATDFTVSHACTTLTLGQSCPVSVTFTPQAAGARTGALNIANSVGPASFGMTGTGELSLVTHYYRSILRRAPDGPGKAFWESEAARMQASSVNINETWYSMAQAFYASPEYVAFGRNDAGFVTDLYNTFFNRGPDGAGLAFWTGQITQGMPREVVLASFMFSTEFVTFTQGIFGNTAVRKEIDTVTDFYRGLLGRLPDGGGLTFWIGQFRAAQCAGAGATAAVNGQAESISSSFATGGEYAARSRTNAQYVGDLYNAFLRRGGDLAGVQFWVNSLGANTFTREQVRQNFVASAEFQGRVAAIIAQGCLP